jgi:ubiquitin related modifier 1
MATLAKVSLYLSGGCELHFGGQSTVELPGTVAADTTLGAFVVWCGRSLATHRADQFLSAGGDGLRPGILCLVNDCDAEVMGGWAYVLQEGDNIAFISTLHGG